MDKVRSKAHKRPKKSSKKSKRSRRSPYYDDSDLKYRRSSKDNSSQKIVEYSDVSSQDFSAPEAGEIQDEEVILSDREPGDNKTIVRPIRADLYEGSDNAKSEFASTSNENKIIVGSPISSSVSSTSKITPLDEDDDKSDESDMDQKRRKLKKSKKKKKKKRKKRRKSISSVESISESDFVLDDDETINLTPPLRGTSTSTWKKHHSSARQPRSISPSPMTPPLRPNSTMSIYSESSRRTPPPPLSVSQGSQKLHASSPHTPPLNSKKSSTYRSPDVEITSVGNQSYFHHSHQSYRHHSRSPHQAKESSRRSKSPSKSSFFVHKKKTF